MSVTPSGHIEELPSGSYRVAVYVGSDPITRKRQYLRETARDSVQAQIVLGKLLARAQAGKEPESGATVGQLLDLYMPLAEWDVSTRAGLGAGCGGAAQSPAAVRKTAPNCTVICTSGTK